jgi:hypothetical protein
LRGTLLHRLNVVSPAQSLSMFSYHRVLKLFGRSVTDKTLECDWYMHLFIQTAFLAR